MSEPNTQWLLQFVLGGLFVAFVTVARFQGPAADRSYTTFFRFCVATGYLVCAYLGVYYALATSAAWLMRALPGIPREYFLASPPWLALLLAGVLPLVPLLSELDHRFRAHARSIGGIPSEAIRLRDVIRQVRCVLPESVSREIHYSVLRRGLDLGDMRSVPDNTIHAMFTHASELKHLLDRCQRQRRFERFFSDNARELHDLSTRYDILMFKSTRTVDAIGGLNDLVDRTSGKIDNWESLGALVETEVYAGKSGVLDPAISTSRMLANNLREDMRLFIDDAVLLIARMVLQYRWTERGRIALMRQLGIIAQPRELPRYGSLVAVFAMVLAAMFFGTMLFGAAGYKTARQIAGTLFMVPTMFIVALFCAIYPKQYFSFANINVYGKPPYLFYVVASLAAAALAFLVGLTFRAFIYQDGAIALNEALRRSPWLLMSMTTAGFMAIMVQDRPISKRISAQGQRWKDAFTLSVALGLASSVVQWLLPYTKQWLLPYAQEPAAGAPVIWAIFISALIGGFIGYFVPHRFRSHEARDLMDRPEAAPVSQARAPEVERVT